MSMVLALVLAEHGANVGIFSFSIYNLFLYFVFVLNANLNKNKEWWNKLISFS